jgi:hypothetical protein
MGAKSWQQRLRYQLMLFGPWAIVGKYEAHIMPHHDQIRHTEPRLGNHEPNIGHIKPQARPVEHKCHRNCNASKQSCTT